MRVTMMACWLALSLGYANLAHAAPSRIDSMYTSLADTACKTLESSEEGGGSYKGRCPGVAGYQLNLLEGDLRQSLTVIDPQGKEFPLEFWSVVTPNFSTVGQKAEWRMKKEGSKTVPIALIVRVNASEDPEKPEKNTSYLVVTKLTANAVCVTDVVKPSSTANHEARILADKSATVACKATP